MKVICSQKSLVNGIQIVQKAISTKLGLPIYNGILFEVTSDNRIHLFSTDLEIGIDCYISAQIVEHGAVVIPSKIFSDLIRRFPEGNIEIEVDKDNIIHIKEEDLSNYKILGFSAEDFSPFPEIQSNIKIKLTHKILKDTIQEVIFASSKDENRSFLNGVLFKRVEKGLEIAATDSHRLALKKIKLAGKNKIETDNQFEVIIPQRALSELFKLLNFEDDNIVEIDIGEKQVIFILNSEGEKNKIRLFSRIIDGQYPDYHQIIPRQFKTIVKIDTEEFKQRMERITLFVKEDLNTIKIETHLYTQQKGENRGELIIKAKTPDIGDACEQIPCLVEGEYVEIAFNSRYIVDVLRVIKTDHTEIRLNENLNPAMINPIDKEEQYNYVLMPVRMD
ncbi:MAG: DNA polymerase III subunit beta [Atribacterota bacterium]|nr:DNA polymerase III subunit beta [Atribacterota bacterium]MDD4895968.1 DNA polymerase III subunit beta [Atribacterota bacterium]MDD5638086.1 DNA polymerase III subunit beta [Atribacterota bacterium]